MLSQARMRCTAVTLPALLAGLLLPIGTAAAQNQGESQSPAPETAPEASAASTAEAVPAAESEPEAVPVAESEPEAVPAADKPPARPDAGHFGFGSYGRVGVGTDLHGSTPEPVKVVRMGSRVIENAYTELDFYYRMETANGVKLRTVTTLAAVDDLFHYTGEFDARLALRNFYAEATIGDLALWVGSRMYRGDDIYLLDYWPLDDTNTLGGGVDFRREKLALSGHIGINRLLHPFQFQEREVSDLTGVGSTTIVELDRQRFMASTKGEYRFLGDGLGPSMKAKLYAEIQGLPAGSRFRNDETVEDLPSDFGYSIGAQLGAWGFAQGRSHANVFLKWSQGLTAFDELELPRGFDDSKKTFPHASEFVLAVSGNYEFPGGGVLVGGYTRRFVDADPNVNDRDDGWEYIADIRPHVAILGDVEAAVDLSYQVRFPRGLSPSTLTALDPGVFQVAPMLLYSPFGTGSYARPQLRLIYRAAHLNAGARDLYPLEDPRRNRSWVHFLGLQAEWWFNSTYR